MSEMKEQLDDADAIIGKTAVASVAKKTAAAKEAGQLDNNGSDQLSATERRIQQAEQALAKAAEELKELRRKDREEKLRQQEKIQRQLGKQVFQAGIESDLPLSVLLKLAKPLLALEQEALLTLQDKSAHEILEALK